MNLRCLPLAAALLWASLPITSAAQAVAAAPSAAASAAPQPGRRLLTPTEQRDIAAPPGELRPERQVVPQIRIPLGKKPAVAAPSASAAMQPGTSSGTANNSVARCKAMSKPQDRRACLDRLAQQKPDPAPNGKR
jgi:hypothetical protein